MQLTPVPGRTFQARVYVRQRNLQRGHLLQSIDQSSMQPAMRPNLPSVRIKLFRACGRRHVLPAVRQRGHRRAGRHGRHRVQLQTWLLHDECLQRRVRGV